MAVQATECYRLVTIEYLKSFIRDGSTLLIQNSSGAGVDVNLNALDSNKRTDSYCPTYGELTGNSLIQNWVEGTSPNLDTDGIVVNPTSLATGSAYGPTQCVDRKDLSLKYTRFKSFSISADPTGVDECGGTSIISYSNNYTRYTKEMNNNCRVTTPSALDVSDTNDSVVKLTTSVGTFGNWSNHTKTLTIPKNGSVSASSRTFDVTGSTNFRGSDKTDTERIYQSSLTGDYTKYVSSYTVVTAVTATSNRTSFGCDGGRYYATGTSYYDTYEVKCWVDSCNDEYPNVTSSTRTSVGNTSSLGTDYGDFSEIDCCEFDSGTTRTNSRTLSFSDGGKSDSITFTQSCRGCSGTTTWVESGTDYTYKISVSPTGGTFGCDGGSETVYATGRTSATTVYVQKLCDGTIDTGVTSSKTETSTTSLPSQTVEFGSMNCCNYKCGSNGTSTKSVRFTHGNISKTVSFTQSCPGCSGTCTGGWEFSGTNVTYQLSASAIGSTSFPCSGGTYRANATESAYTSSVYVWKDDCGNYHPSKTSATTPSYSGSTTLSEKTGKFQEMDCCAGDDTDTGMLSFEAHGNVAVVTFTQTCASCTPCSPSCVKGNNDGTNNVGGVPDYTCAPVCGNGTPGTYAGGDSLYVSNVSINGTSISTDPNNLTPLTSWARAYIGPNGTDHGLCGFGYLYVQYDPFDVETEEVRQADSAHKYRTAYVSLDTTDSNVCDAGKVSGVTEVCHPWIYVLRQAFCGYEFCTTGRHYEYTTVPIGGTCPQGSSKYHGGCPACTETTYSYTVYSNVVGAVVTFAGSYTYVVGSSGKVVYSQTSSGDVVATIALQGCNFSSTSATIHRNSSATLNGSCPTCTKCTDANIREIVVQKNQPASGGGGTFLTFVTNCEDISKYSIVHTGGSNIIKLNTISISYYAPQQRMMVSASMNANPYGSGRVENFGIRFNGVICHTDEIKQNGNNPIAVGRE